MCYSTFAFDVALLLVFAFLNKKNFFLNVGRMYKRCADMCGNEIRPTPAVPSLIEIRPTPAVPSLIEIRPTLAVPSLIAFLQQQYQV